MTADTAGAAMAEDAVGRTTITSRALRSLAARVVGEAAGVPAATVSAELSDEAGVLKATARVPVAIGPHGRDSLVARGATIRRALIDGLRDLGDRRVGHVDIRFSGVHRAMPRRVT
jgi:hypothetical protein